MSISWPVDVQHLDQSSKKRPPTLESSGDQSIEERRSPRLTSPQAPKHLQLQGIQVGYAVETRAANMPKLSHTPKPRSAAANVKDDPSSPVLRERDNETQINTKMESESDLGDEVHEFPATPPARLRRHTKESASGGLRSPNQDTRKDVPSFENPFPSGSIPFRNRAPSAASTKSRMTLPLVPVPEEDPVPFIHEPHSGAEISDRMKLPLPPLPSSGALAQQLCGDLTQESTQKPHSRPHSMSPGRRAAKKRLLVPSSSSDLLPPPPAKEAISATQDGSGPSRNGSSKVLHSHEQTKFKTQSILSATSWEDDVDFSYDQEAESTCNFNWRTSNSQRPLPPLLVAVGKAVNSPADPWIMTSPTSPGLYSPSLSESSSSIRRSISGRAHRYRGTSVGHRAFRLRHKYPAEAPHPTMIEPLVPKRQISITSTDGGSAHVIKGSGAGQPSKSHRHHRSDALNSPESSAHIDYLSDPESLDWQRRISSSYGSCRSSLRRSHTEPVGDSPRWSATSSSGVPDLLRSQRKSEIPLHDQFSFCDLLDAHPHSAAAGAENFVLPSRPHTPESAEQHFMRRPQTPSDRMILQNAGRAVQRGRIDRQSRSAPAVPTLSSPTTTNPSSSRKLWPLDRMPQRDFEDWI
nr:hypothetical protein CFP56_34731 [Quercus suber]